MHILISLLLGFVQAGAAALIGFPAADFLIYGLVMTLVAVTFFDLISGRMVNSWLISRQASVTVWILGLLANLCFGIFGPSLWMAAGLPYSIPLIAVVCLLFTLLVGSLGIFTIKPPVSP